MCRIKSIYMHITVIRTLIENSTTSGHIKLSYRSSCSLLMPDLGITGHRELCVTQQPYIIVALPSVCNVRMMLPVHTCPTVMSHRLLSPGVTMRRIKNTLVHYLH